MESCLREAIADPQRWTMKRSKTTGKESSAWTRGEAMDVLAQCQLIRMSVDALEQKAEKVLNRPELSLVKSKD